MLGEWRFFSSSHFNGYFTCVFRQLLLSPGEADPGGPARAPSPRPTAMPAPTPTPAPTPAPTPPNPFAAASGNSLTVKGTTADLDTLYYARGVYVHWNYPYKRLDVTSELRHQCTPGRRGHRRRHRPLQPRKLPQPMGSQPEQFPFASQQPWNARDFHGDGHPVPRLLRNRVRLSPQAA